MTQGPSVEWGVASAALEDSHSGDQHFVVEGADSFLAVVIDALGHGPIAERAARVAVTSLEEDPTQPLETLVQRAHAALRGTRGAVLSLARIAAGNLTWLGVGNVEGLLLRRAPGEGKGKGKGREYLLLRGGVVGYRLPTLRPASLALEPGDTLILATDGIREGFIQYYQSEDTPQANADRILSQGRRTTDDALVLVARYSTTPVETR